MTVIQDKEVWELATAVIAKHGAAALGEAERKAKEAFDADDMIGHSVWLSVKEAIEELARSPAGDEPVN
jgi:hypothetical protein